MGRKLDALLGRNFKTSKFKTMAKLAISRVAILKNQRQSRFTHAHSDVIELLNLGHHERALLRVEYVIKEQNMLDALVMIENYCHLLIERAALIQTSRECPEELKEAISGMVFASSRCGEFPELQKVREMLTLWFGKEFVARAVELRNNCSVNPKIVQKFSSRQASLESRLKVLREIASENDITLHLEEDTPVVIKEKSDVNQKQQGELANSYSKIKDGTQDEVNLDDDLSESVKTRKKYRDAAAAAKDAFQSAAYAAVAARAAVELSSSGSNDNNSDDNHGGYDQKQGTDGEKTAVMITGSGNIHQVDDLTSESEDEVTVENTSRTEPKEPEMNEMVLDSSSDLDAGVLKGKEKGFENVYNEAAYKQGDILSVKHDDSDSERKPGFTMNKHQDDTENYGNDQNLQESTLNSQDDSMMKFKGSETRSTGIESLNYVEKFHHKSSDIDWKPLSVRTRRVQRV